MDKVCSLISEQFAIELDQKEREIQLIDQRLSDVHSMLDRLRASAVFQYYGLTDVDPGTRSDPLKSTALKFTAGGGYVDVVGALPDSAGASNSHTGSVSPTSNVGDGNERMDSSDVVTGVSRNALAPGLDGSGSSHVHVRKCIVVGNTSRFIREDQREVNDQSTHKWTVYVRGPKEEPRIDHFVSRVWFYLHPSYKPNDVVEVSQAPFHLTRRGWGEFPIRVRLVLSDNRHKHVDITHSLRLDRTYTGMQTLGAETTAILELDRQAFLQQQQQQSASAGSDPGYASDERAGGVGALLRPPTPLFTMSQPLSASQQAPTAGTLCSVRVEHSYARPSSSITEAKLAVAEARSTLEVPCHHQVMDLKAADLAARIGDHLSTVTTSTGAISMEQALCDGVRFFPLVSSAQDRTQHPYVARTTAEFRSWSVGKQRGSEWQRALALRRSLEARALLPSVHKATTRYVFAWCRAQGHSRVILMGGAGPQSGVPRAPLPLCGLCSRLLGNGEHDVHVSCRSRCAQVGLTLSSCAPLLKALALQQAATLSSTGAHRRQPASAIVDVLGRAPAARQRPRVLRSSVGRRKPKQSVTARPLFPRYWCRDVLSQVRLADAVRTPPVPAEESVMVPYPAEVALNAASQCMLQELLTAAVELAGKDSNSFNSGIAPTLTVFHIHASLARLPHLDILSDSGLASL